MQRRELQGWESIADYLKKSVRAVQNYERRGLPVRRLGGPRSPVFAYTDELDAWKEGQNSEFSIQAANESERATEALLTPPTSADPTPSIEAKRKLTRPFGGHLGHVLLASILYALLYVASLLLEIVYLFDQFGQTALKLAPVVFFWILLTSLVGLTIQWQQVQRHQSKGLAFSLLLFVGSALALHAALTLFLPTTPVTEASFQTLPAQSAFLKNTFSFLQAAALFVVTPFHFILAAQAALADGGHSLVLASIRNSTWYYTKRLTADALYIRREWLILGLFIAASLFIASSWHVFDKLKPSPYMNAFVHLFLLRDTLWLVLAVKCLFWYNQHLNQAVQDCEAALNPAELSAAGPAN